MAIYTEGGARPVGGAGACAILIGLNEPPVFQRWSSSFHAVYACIWVLATFCDLSSDLVAGRTRRGPAFGGVKRGTDNSGLLEGKLDAVGRSYISR